MGGGGGVKAQKGRWEASKLPGKGGEGNGPQDLLTKPPGPMDGTEDQKKRGGEENLALVRKGKEKLTLQGAEREIGKKKKD